MDEDLEILLEYFNEEKKILENAIEEYVEENEYKFAHRQFKGLIIANHKLRILNKLKDSLYDEKKHLQLQKKFFEKMIKSKNYMLPNELYADINRMEKFYEAQLNELKIEEDKLNKRPLPSYIPGQELDNAIYDVVEKKVRSFKFWINKESNTYFVFKVYNESLLKISFTPLNLINQEQFFFRPPQKSLKALGFKFDVNEQSYSYFYDIKKFSNTTFLKTLLSRIVFDIFLFHTDNPTFIEYEE